MKWGTNTIGRRLELFIGYVGTSLILLSLPLHADFSTDLEKAKVAGKTDFEAARQQYAQLRQEVMASGQLAYRLQIDDLDCTLSQDFNGSISLAVAKEGLTTLNKTKSPTRDARLAGLRLAACEADTLFDMNEAIDAEAKINKVITEAATDIYFEPARAVALRIRGNMRSRHGELSSGQSDLLEACKSSRQLNLPDDIESCDNKLASHFRRTGDFEEALKLLRPRLQYAVDRNLTIDIGVYAHNIARVEVEVGRFDDALNHYKMALAVSERTNNSTSLSYDHTGAANALKGLARYDEALVHARAASSALPWGSDDTQRCNALLLQAELLIELRDIYSATIILNSLQDQSAIKGMLRSQWLALKGKAYAQKENWQRAYEVLQEKIELDKSLTKEKLSAQSATLRTQYNRERDAAELEALQKAQREKEDKLTKQYILLTVAVGSLLMIAGFATRKVWQSRLLQKMASSDELTGLPNRREIQLRLRNMFRQSQSQKLALSVLMLDIDHFKTVNDTHGHAVGDEVLRHVAQLLANEVRSGDLVGRLGGEEFVAILPHANIESAYAIAERMRQSVEKTPCHSSAGHLNVTISIGAATIQSSDAKSDELLERADNELYEAKHRGRNRISVAKDAETGS